MNRWMERIVIGITGSVIGAALMSSSWNASAQELKHVLEERDAFNQLLTDLEPVPPEEPERDSSWIVLQAVLGMYGDVEGTTLALLEAEPRRPASLFGQEWQAIELAARYRFKEAIPLLLDRLEFVGNDFYVDTMRDEPRNSYEFFNAVRAVGEIGGDAAWQALSRLEDEKRTLTDRQVRILAYIILRCHLELFGKNWLVISGTSEKDRQDYYPDDDPGRMSAVAYLEYAQLKYKSKPDSQINWRLIQAIDFVHNYQLTYGDPPAEFRKLFPDRHVETYKTEGP